MSLSTSVPKPNCPMSPFPHKKSTRLRFVGAPTALLGSLGGGSGAGRGLSPLVMAKRLEGVPGVVALALFAPAEGVEWPPLGALDGPGVLLLDLALLGAIAGNQDTYCVRNAKMQIAGLLEVKIDGCFEQVERRTTQKKCAAHAPLLLDGCAQHSTQRSSQ